MTVASVSTAPMRLTWYGHSCFLAECGGTRLLFDPFLTGNPLAPGGGDAIDCDYVFCTHAHNDHLGDALEIAKRCNATLVAPFELAEYLSAKGANTLDPMPGGQTAVPFGSVKAVPALHSSSLEGPAGCNQSFGVAVGYVVTIGRRRLYHAGDTALYTDMHLIGRLRLDVALLPIGDHYTMGPDDALRALDYLCPSLCVPMHYNTFPPIRVNAAAFAHRAKLAGHKVQVLEPGGSLEC